MASITPTVTQWVDDNKEMMTDFEKKLKEMIDKAFDKIKQNVRQSLEVWDTERHIKAVKQQSDKGEAQEVDVVCQMGYAGKVFDGSPERVLEESSSDFNKRVDTRKGDMIGERGNRPGIAPFQPTGTHPEFFSHITPHFNCYDEVGKGTDVGGYGEVGTDFWGSYKDGGSGGGPGHGRVRTLDIPRFDGNDPDWWVMRVESVFSSHCMSEEEMLEAVAMVLGGDALQLYQWENNRRPFRCWTDLKGVILRQYGSSTYPNSSRSYGVYGGYGGRSEFKGEGSHLNEYRDKVGVTKSGNGQYSQRYNQHQEGPMNATKDVYRADGKELHNTAYWDQLHHKGKSVAGGISDQSNNYNWSCFSYQQDSNAWHPSSAFSGRYGAVEREDGSWDITGHTLSFQPIHKEVVSKGEMEAAGKRTPANDTSSNLSSKRALTPILSTKNDREMVYKLHEDEYGKFGSKFENVYSLSFLFVSSPFPDVSSSDPTINSPESPLSRSLSEEAEYENFFSAIDISGQNLTRKSVQFSNNIPRTHNDDTFPVIDLRLKLHIYKISFLLLTRKLKAAKQEIKMAMITGYAQNGEGLRAIECFRDMRGEDVECNQYTIPSVFTACAAVSACGFGTQVHSCIVRAGFERNVFVESALVNMYAKCVSINYDKYAKSVHSIIVKTGYDVYKLVGNALMDMYAKQNDLDSAFKVFNSMTDKDVVSWTSLVTGYAHIGSPEEALKLFYGIRIAGIEPDQVVISNVLSLSAELTTLEIGQQVHAKYIKYGFGSSVLVDNSLVTMYTTCGNIEDASRIFNLTQIRNVISWTALIVGYAQNGRAKESLLLYDSMTESGIKPDFITFIGLLFACSHAGLAERAHQYFESMTRIYGIKPGPDHYACMIDLLGRSGKMLEAEKLLNEMDVEPDATVWKALLSACRVHEVVELAERATEALFKLELQNAMPYIMLSNIYSAAGTWEDSARIIRMMKKKGISKEPGCSWIELNSQVHTFTFEDRSHPNIGDIYSKIDKVMILIKEAGYVPDMTYALHDVNEECKEHGLAFHGERLAVTSGPYFEALLKWKTWPYYEATWEDMTTVAHQFPHFHLEDKVSLLGRGIVVTSQPKEPKDWNQPNDLFKYATYGPEAGPR